MDLSRFVGSQGGRVDEAGWGSDGLMLDMWIVVTVENNLDSPPGTIDLHGLYVKEGERASSFCHCFSDALLSVG